MSNSFTQEDYLHAREAFCKWQGSVNESIDEYLLRKRKAELNELVRKVIREELTSSDKLIVELHWYQGLSNKEIAAKLNIDPSTVSRRLNKINEVIFDKLKYAIEYRYGSSFVPNAQIIIKNRQAACSYNEPKNISERIACLRSMNCLSPEDVSEMTGISKDKIAELEKKADKLSAEQARRLALCFRTTTDYIISGK